MLLLAGCASPATPEPATAADPSGSITVTDALGRAVTLAQPPQRIVVAGKANFMLNDAIYLFPEAPARVIALTKAQQNTDAFVALLDPDYAQKFRFTLSASAEEIAAVHPDLVILKGYMAESLGTPLEQLSIPVVYLDFETPEQYERDLGTLGQLFNDTARAGEVWGYFETQLDRVATAVEGLSETDKPRVLVLQYTDKGGEIAFQAPPESWIQTQMVELSGGAPVWKEASPGGWAVVNFEQIAAWNPDQIFVINYFGNVDEVVAGLMSDPRWQQLAAVQAHQVYAFPKEYYSWDQPDTRWGLGLLWLAGRIHPERFPDLDMRAEIDRFYGKLYGMDAATVAANVIPRLEGDVGAK
jgi:iron complex transport system substrate-binding protein